MERKTEKKTRKAKKKHETKCQQINYSDVDLTLSLNADASQTAAGKRQ